MGVVVFEDDGWRLFTPLNRLKHTSLLRWGTKTILDLISESTEGRDVEVWGRKELAEVTMAGEGVQYNRSKEGTALIVNARARPGRALLNLTSRKTPFVALSRGSIVAARVNLSRVTAGVLSRREVARLSKGSEKLEAPGESLFGGYWELVDSNGLAIAEQAPHFSDSLTLPGTCRLRGPPSSLRIHGSAEVEDYVAFDTRLGPVVIGEGASVESFSRVSGPCYVGDRAKLLSALVRGGTSIFDGCKVGGEVENSILMPHTNKAHFGYVGDSYVGEWVNLGAGSTFSNLKNTYGNVRTNAAGKRVDTGLLKLGPAIADMAKVSIGALVFAGRRVDAASQVTGLAAEDVPAFTFYDGARRRRVELFLDSVLETQRRVKERRGLTLTRAEEDLVRYAFRDTAADRKRAGVSKGRIR